MWASLWDSSAGAANRCRAARITPQPWPAPLMPRCSFLDQVSRDIGGERANGVEVLAVHVLDADLAPERLLQLQHQFQSGGRAHTEIVHEVHFLARVGDLPLE